MEAVSESGSVSGYIGAFLLEELLLFSIFKCLWIHDGEQETASRYSSPNKRRIQANFGDDPWHAGIFRRVARDRDPDLICGATIISRTVVISGSAANLIDCLR